MGGLASLFIIGAIILVWWLMKNSGRVSSWELDRLQKQTQKRVERYVPEYKRRMSENSEQTVVKQERPDIPEKYKAYFDVHPSIKKIYDRKMDSIYNSDIDVPLMIRICTVEAFETDYGKPIEEFNKILDVYNENWNRGKTLYPSEYIEYFKVNDRARYVWTIAKVADETRDKQKYPEDINKDYFAEFNSAYRLNALNYGKEVTN